MLLGSVLRNVRSRGLDHLGVGEGFQVSNQGGFLFRGQAEVTHEASEREYRRSFGFWPTVSGNGFFCAETGYQAHGLRGCSVVEVHHLLQRLEVAVMHIRLGETV